MNPVFPNFKSITQDDKVLIESITSKYPPYSDFNFISLYSWNTDGNTLFSILNNNLVIKMKDYTSEDTLFTFLGNNVINDTVDTLLPYAKRCGTDTLTLIPEINFINNSGVFKKYSVEEDRDQFDYIYSLDAMIKMDGRVFRRHRNMIRNFEFNYASQVRTESLNLDDSNKQKEILFLYECWKDLKIKNSKTVDETELLAIKNLLNLQIKNNLVCYGLYIENNLIAFSIVEILPNNYCNIHFEKTNSDYKGIGDYLTLQIAKDMLKQGITYQNVEQDLGIEGLRRSKLSYNPETFLKKYKVTNKT